MELEIFVDEEIIQPSFTFFLNRETKSIAGEIDGLEAVKQAANCILDTMRFGYEIFDASYGSEIESLINKPYEFVRTELPRIVTEALLRDERISSVVVTDIRQVSVESVSFSCDIFTAYGDFNVNEMEVQIWQ